MKVAIYPGSFDPWHEGHIDILDKALQLFDKVYIVRMRNPAKPFQFSNLNDTYHKIHDWARTRGMQHKVDVSEASGLLVDVIRKGTYDAVIRGLRNGQDFEYERVQQYYNEDLGISIPTVYLISDRKLVHISSSAIRMIEGLKV